MLKPTLLSVALAGLLAGCSVKLATPTHAEVVPSSYRSADAAAPANIERQWWRMYNDPELNRLVEITLRDNPYTQVAKQRQIAAEAQTKLANADRLPQLGASAGFANSRTSTNTALGEMLGRRSISGDKYTLGLDGAWQIDIWNRVANAVAAAKAGVEAEQAYGRMVEQTLSWEVADFYWRFRLAESDLALYQRIRAERAEAEAVLAGRFNAGLIGELDLARARLELRNVEADIEDADKRLRQAEHELATLTVQPAATFRVVRAPNYRMPEVPLIQPGLPAALLARRADLQMSAQNVRALLAQKNVAETAFYPSISLTGNFGFASLDLRNLTNSDSRQLSLGPIAISLPILDGGRIRANQKITEARYQAAISEHKVQLLIALREVDDALAEVESQRSQQQLRAAALEQARRVARLARARYDQGTINYLLVADAERELASAEQRYRRNRFAGLLATTNLVYTLGGGFAAPEAKAE